MKSPLRNALPDDLTLIETFGRRDGQFVNLTAHLARLERTARAPLAIPLDRDALHRSLEDVPQEGFMRVRIRVDREGSPTVQAEPVAPGPDVWTVAIHDTRLDPEDPWLRIKTSVRARYDAARAALPAGVDEWLFLNTRGEVCEGTITNVFLRSADRLLTPPVECGLLPGVLRANLLKDGAEEAVIKVADLQHGEILVGNSLRGIAPARLR